MEIFVLLSLHRERQDLAQVQYAHNLDTMTNTNDI